MARVQQAAGTAIEAGLAWRNAGKATEPEPLPSPAKFQKQEGHGGLSGPCQYVDGPQKFLLEFGRGGETIEASSTG